MTDLTVQTAAVADAEKKLLNGELVVQDVADVTGTPAETVVQQ